VLWTPEHVAGIEPATGKVRWQVPFASTYDVAISDPIYHDGILLVSGYWEGAKAIRLDEKGANPKVIWEGRQLSLLMSTPLYRDGYVYALDKTHGLQCLKLATGAVAWQGKHLTPRGRNPHASLIWAAKRMLLLNELGELKLVDVTPQTCQEISKAQVIKDGTWAHPAYADSCIFVRNDQEITCVPLPRK
jgi:hypothetical protein